MSSSNFCSIKLKPFCLFKLPVSLDHKLSTTKKKGQSFFCNFNLQNVELSTYLSFPLLVGSILSNVIRYSDSGNFCSIQFKPFWLPQLPVTGKQAHSSNKKIIARVIFVMLANSWLP